LARQIDLVDPPIVVTLGAQALYALRLISEHKVDLATGVRKKWEWNGRILIPLYHPGQRAMIHRSFLNQLADYRFVAETFRRLSKRRRTNVASTSAEVTSIARNLLHRCGPLSYFALHKLFYLLEYEHVRAARCRITNTYIIRQKDGPYVVDLNIKKLKKALPDMDVWSEGGRLMLAISDSDLFFEEGGAPGAVSPTLENALQRVSQNYARRADGELKRIVYLTSPMRHILRREKFARADMFNAPIDFSLVTAKAS
jgi:hypothetical protein